MPAEIAPFERAASTPRRTSRKPVIGSVTGFSPELARIRVHVTVRRPARRHADVDFELPHQAACQQHVSRIGAREEPVGCRSLSHNEFPRRLKGQPATVQPGPATLWTCPLRRCSSGRQRCARRSEISTMEFVRPPRLGYSAAMAAARCSAALASFFRPVFRKTFA